MGSKAPPVVQPPAPERPPPAPPASIENAQSMLDDPDASQARKTQAREILERQRQTKQRERERKGRASTIMTSRQGVTEEANTTGKTLLGDY